MKKDSLKQVGEKVDLLTFLRRRKVLLTSFFINNGITKISDLEKFALQYEISEEMVIAAKHYCNSLEKTKTLMLPIEAQIGVKEISEHPISVDESVLEDEKNDVHKSGKRKKS